MSPETCFLTPKRSAMQCVARMRGSKTDVLRVPEHWFQDYAGILSLAHMLHFLATRKDLIPRATHR